MRKPYGPVDFFVCLGHLHFAVAQAIGIGADLVALVLQQRYVQRYELQVRRRRHVEVPAELLVELLGELGHTVDRGDDGGAGGGE